MSTFTVVEERELADLVETRFTVSAAGEPAPGVLFRPDGEEGLPLVVIQHPATSSKDDYFVRDVGMMWARRGWACMGLDAPYHGERATFDPMGLLRDRERFQAASVQFAAELTAAVDAIVAAYPVDAARLGYVGYSMGSLLGIPAVAADGRYRAAAFCLVGEGGMLGAADDPASPVQRLDRLAVRIVAKLQDEFFSREATENLLAAIPSPDKELSWLPGGHFEVGPDVIKSAEQWLERKL
jgi:dienelactone hydrolase